MKVLETIEKNGNLPIVREKCEIEESKLQSVIISKKDELIKRFTKFLGKLKPKPFPWKFINLRNGLIAGCLALIAVAGYLNVKYGSEETVLPEKTPPQTSEASKIPQSTAEEDYFASAVIDRERARGEALEVLLGITEDDLADTAARDAAYKEMEKIANQTNWEINIENLIRAKGFSECIAVISNNTANIVVESDGLTPGEVAQIKEIVYLSSDIVPSDVKIIEKQSKK